MNKKIKYLARQVLVGILLLPLLNLGIGNEAYLDADYDYSYTYNKACDPTETAVEWIVEMKMVRSLKIISPPPELITA